MSAQNVTYRSLVTLGWYNCLDVLRSSYDPDTVQSGSHCFLQSLYANGGDYTSCQATTSSFYVVSNSVTGILTLYPAIIK